jgi:UDPglucose 6-dehydrogenase
MNLTVIGIGKLGLGFALLLEKYGYTVMGVDINEDYVSKINSKKIEFHEPGYNQLLKESTGFFATTSLEEGLSFSDIIFILVQTPNGGGDRFYDHSILSNLLMKINKCNYFNKNIIIGCTVMPGYINQVAKTLLPDSYISYNPEFVAQGDIIYGFENSDVILVGTEYEHVSVLLKSIYSFNK